MRAMATSLGDFGCVHCHNLVSAAHLLSGVNNRNHCPYCLWSCHLDLFVAGDRLSACKGQMKPIGLTMKKSRNKYRLESRGELMLVHECTECRTLSINRIAADDDPENILTIFQDSFLYGHPMRQSCESQGIIMLDEGETEMAYQQLYGQVMEMSVE